MLLTVQEPGLALENLMILDGPVLDVVILTVQVEQVALQNLAAQVKPDLAVDLTVHEACAPF